MTYYKNAPSWARQPRNISNLPDIIDALERAHPYLAPIIFDDRNRLGCGSFGCAYQTKDPRVVLKLTDDIFEGPGAQALMDTKKDWPGLIKPWAVYKLEHYPPLDFGNDLNLENDGDYHHGNMCILLMESVGTGRMSSVMEASRGPERRRLSNAMGALQWRSVSEVWAGNPHGDAYWNDQWLPAIVRMARSQPTGMKDIKDSFKKLWMSYSLVFPDLHPGNVGFRKLTINKKMRPKIATWNMADHTKFNYQVAIQLDLGVSSGSGLQGHFPPELLERELRAVGLDGKPIKKMRGKGHKQLSLFSNPYRYRSLWDSIPTLR